MAQHLDIHRVPYDREVCLIPGRKFRVDFLIKPNLAIEVEGVSAGFSRHQTISGYRKDCEKYNLLTKRGYRVLRYTQDMVKRGEAINDVLDVLGV